MSMNLVGKQIVTPFTNRETGEVIEGIKLHYTAPEDRVSGQAALTKFINKNSPLYEKALALEFGEFTIVYGRRDSVIDLLQG